MQAELRYDLTSLQIQSFQIRHFSCWILSHHHDQVVYVWLSSPQLLHLDLYFENLFSTLLARETAFRPFYWREHFASDSAQIVLFPHNILFTGLNNSFHIKAPSRTIFSRSVQKPDHFSTTRLSILHCICKPPEQKKKTGSQNKMLTVLLLLFSLK